MVEKVDSRSVLRIVNGMGYKNVSTDELKEFTKDLKKLIKYEKQPRHTKKPTQTRHEPENVINVTIVNQTLPTDDVADKTATMPRQPEAVEAVEPQQTDTQTQTSGHTDKCAADKTKNPKKILHLAKSMKTKNTNVVFKNAADGSEGILVRNTPTDLYHKYQSDWAKFKSYIPGENRRQSVRDRVHAKMLHRDDEPHKVYVYYPENHRRSNID